MIHRFTHEQVKQIFSNEHYELGRSFIEEKRVFALHYDKDVYRWIAHVMDKELYKAEIEMRYIEQGRVGLICSCDEFQLNKDCPHVAAVMIAVADEMAQQFEVTLEETEEVFANILALRRSLPFEQTEKQLMHVEYIIRLDDWNKVWLECKTGISHRYVVRNMRDFLQHVLNDDVHIFTKKFSYDPTLHYFKEADLAVFTMLKEMIDTGDVFTNREVTADQVYDRRSVLIPPLVFRSLLETLQEHHASVVTIENEYNDFSVESDKLPVQFSIQTGESETLQLNVTGLKESIYFPTYKMLFSKGKFYFPKDEQLYVIEQFTEAVSKSERLPISQRTKEKLFSEIVPVLKEASEVNIANEVKEELLDVPLHAKVYLQLKEDKIHCELEYHYGPYKINPFVENGETEIDKIIIRDIKKERAVMSLVEQANFHYNGSDLYLPAYDDERVFHLLYVILPQLEKIAQAFVTSDIRRLVIEESLVPRTTVDVQEGTNLLEIGFDISGVDEKEVKRLLQAVIERKKYYRFKSGSLVSLETEEYEELSDLLNELRIKKSHLTNETITLPVYHGVQIAEGKNCPITYSDSFKKLLDEIKRPGEREFKLPDNLRTKLRPYQKIGFQWFKSLSAYHLGGILADDMGLGKTVQTIAYLLSEQSVHPHLVIAPSSVVYNWRNECRRFAPNLEIAVISGTPDERKRKLETSYDKDVWITSYGALRQDIHRYRELTFEVLILDEAQYVKNSLTKTARSVRELNALKRFALSGTPIENSLDDLWSIFNIILPNFLPSKNDFRKMDPTRISRITQPFILRRLKTDVLEELPEKIETVHVSELTEDQKKLYVGYLDELRNETTRSLKENGFQKSRMKILSGITRLRQLCCHPSLFIENYTGSSGKLEELIGTVETLKANGRRMLIFSQFTAMHEIIIKELEKRKVSYFYLHGNTPAKKRVEMSEAFNNGKKDVFLISLKAGGTGLNLTGADTVILYDLWWNPAVEDQAAGRAHRYGQKNVVHVIRFISEGTIEEKMYELQQKKRELIDRIIQPGEKLLSSLTEEEVRELLNI